MAGGYFFGWYGVGSQWIKAACNADGQLIIDAAAIFENPPVEDETGKGPSSEWAYDHGANAAAHHARYTDAEAQAAVNLAGTLYWTAPGAQFGAANPDTDQVQKDYNGSIIAGANNISFICPVFLPHGATITGVIVYGDAVAQGEIYNLYRLKLSDLTKQGIAYANIGTEDTSLSYTTVNNSEYIYFFITSTLDINDTIYGARISFTL